MNPQINQMLEGLANFLRNGVFTPARHVDAETYVCFTEQTPHGMMYHQGTYEGLQPNVKQLFMHRERGERVGPFKIVAIFDFWVPTDTQPMVAKYSS